MKTDQPFHYAFQVVDLASTRAFYCGLLGCEEGRSTNTWVDFDFFGHQLSAHVSANRTDATLDYCGNVDGINVPIPHFGCVLEQDAFQQVFLALRGAGVTFLVEPKTRYEGKIGEQKTMFVLDYSGNPLEFKCLAHTEHLFSGS